jgi:hypothetical protein
MDQNNVVCYYHYLFALLFQIANTSWGAQLLFQVLILLRHVQVRILCMINLPPQKQGGSF